MNSITLALSFYVSRISARSLNNNLIISRKKIEHPVLSCLVGAASFFRALATANHPLCISGPLVITAVETSATSSPSMENIVADINRISAFLADAQIQELDVPLNVDCIVIAPSPVLHGAENVFRALEKRTLIANTLVLCGGIGHSTDFIYEAIAQHPIYAEIFPTINGLPEGRVFAAVLNKYFDVDAINEAGCRVLVEEKSTNCGANCFETRRLLERTYGEDFVPSSILINQDPTMQRRTRASFERVYEDVQHPPVLLSYPGLVPSMRASSHGNGSGLEFVTSPTLANGLWSVDRFCSLLIGEIPRLRDDESGYGPRGKLFIVHVDISDEVEDAHKRLQVVFGSGRI